MIKEAMEYLLNLYNDPVVMIEQDDVDRARVLVKDGYHVERPAKPSSIALASIGPMVAFIKAELAPDAEFIRVKLDGDVEVFGPEHPVTKERPVLASCVLPPIGTLTQCGEDSVGPNHYQTAETMIPDLLTQFENTESRAALLKVLGNVTDGSVHTYEDDGVGQQVTTKRGVSMKQMTDLPSPLTLKPRASYPELDNVSQEYILRAKGGGEDAPPRFALIRVFDPWFEHMRRKEITHYLSKELDGEMVIV